MGKKNYSIYDPTAMIREKDQVTFWRKHHKSTLYAKPTRETCIKIVKVMPSLFPCVPKWTITKEMIYYAVRCPSNIKHFDPKLPFYGNLCKTAVTKDPSVVEFIPVEFVTFELMREIVDQGKFVRENNIEFIGQCNFTVGQKMTLYRKSVQLRCNLISVIPKDYQTQEMCVEAIESDYNNIKYVDLNLFDISQRDEICTRVAKIYPLLIQYLPKKYQTESNILEMSMKCKQCWVDPTKIDFDILSKDKRVRVLVNLIENTTNWYTTVRIIPLKELFEHPVFCLATFVRIYHALDPGNIDKCIVDSHEKMYESVKQAHAILKIFVENGVKFISSYHYAKKYLVPFMVDGVCNLDMLDPDFDKSDKDKLEKEYLEKCNLASAKKYVSINGIKFRMTLDKFIVLVKKGIVLNPLNYEFYEKLSESKRENLWKDLVSFSPEFLIDNSRDLNSPGSSGLSTTMDFVSAYQKIIDKSYKVPHNCQPHDILTSLPFRAISKDKKEKFYKYFFESDNDTHSKQITIDLINEHIMASDVQPYMIKGALDMDPYQKIYENKSYVIALSDIENVKDVEKHRTKVLCKVINNLRKANDNLRAYETRYYSRGKYGYW